MLRMAASVVVAVALLAMPAAAEARPAQPWHIRHSHWRAADEVGFARFVAAIGESGCASSESCLRSRANPYRGSDPPWFDADLDCAKLPYFLLAYYAWKNGLPFSYVDAIAGGADLRYGRGNRPVARHDVVDRGGGIDGPRSVLAVADTVFSASYRMDAGEHGRLLSHFYSPAIAPGSIRPGTVLYDTNGHIGIVYRVDAGGRIHYMSAHPDFSPSPAPSSAPSSRAGRRGLVAASKAGAPSASTAPTATANAISSVATSSWPATARSPTSRWSSIEAPEAAAASPMPASRSASTSMSARRFRAGGRATIRSTSSASACAACAPTSRTEPGRSTMPS